ncbi:MAG: protein translocase subunit SecDF [Bacteroidales bacterium]|uniref:protein translocase subunit SecDF n=1 Tax=Prevotellamassilia timonensis TaxID=1852370 RepID=UPI001F19C5A2|nr:protein translocase subunit SecDF [Prevotellamassilia timonensis]MCF2635517.1 protein translocase subunit SecDF [Prevotellamassilia timonensis]MDD6537598.1 protein translocase subunit SecDF [Bacteroidales bacterium]
MQNKGFVKVIAVLLTLICLFYFSFSFVTRKYEKKAEELTAQGKDGAAFLDSMRNEKVFLNWKTLKECEELQIGLGLDLKGGMNVVLEVSVPDVVKNLAGESASDAKFVKAYGDAVAKAKKENIDFVDAFVSTYREQNGADKLGGVFASKLKEKNISYNSTDAQVQKALNEEVNAAVENSNKVVRSRIDRFGVAQPNIQILRGKGQTGQIMVEMPGIKEPERVRKLLQGSANLEFWETYTLNEIYPALQALDTRLAKGDVADSAAVDSTKAEASKTAQDAAAQHPLLSKLMQIQGMAPNGCVVGYALAADTAAVNALLQSEAAQTALPADLQLAWGVKSAEGMKANIFELYALRKVNGRPSMEGDVIADAKDDFDQNHQPIVSMTMTTNGSRDWAALTKKNLKKCVAIVLDGYVYSAPVVQSEITGGNSQISGHFTTDDTRDLANVLKSGKMPAPTKIVQEETVGPSLGAASIKAGFTACIVAFVLLMIFMCLFYGFTPGMVANCALLLNFFFTFGVLISFQAALTMSGIAGMVLSLGMAVDANVLIYERTKEELRAGKNIVQALKDGYGNAYSAILDSNLTSIITAVILYNFGTGPIRGFAMTLGIGICASFFTAVWLTRIAYEHFHNRDKWLGLTFTTKLSRNFLRNTSVNFMGKARVSTIMFVVAAVISVGFLSIRGLSKGIDFTGGRNYVIEFEQKGVTPEQVSKAVAEKVNAKDPNALVSAIAITTTNNEAVRLTTNYRIDDDSENIDQEVERFIFDALHDAKLIKADYSTFIDRDNHAGGSIVSAQKVGPTVAADMAKGAITSVLLSLAAIFIYILVRFRNVAFSIGSTVALVFDTLLILGMYSICWGWVPFSLEVDQTFIGAVLTAIGYSINDKVVVFDRMRENLGLHPTRDTRRLFNDSLNSTLCRTIMTSFTTLLVLLCIFFLGGDSIRSFAFAMILGVIFGTLSSIFLAAPIAYATLRRKDTVVKVA